MTLLRSRRGLAVLGAVVLLALFLIRPGATRLKLRITNSIGQALQRQVEIGRVRLRVLPRPGFDLEDFVVYDSPAFGAEPVLRAQEVSAGLRLSSLLRGRLEISRLVLTEPSLNLVRDGDGHWNLENLLEQAARTSVAPTRTNSEGRAAFPYIEADRGRINFKFGTEKKSFALTDADYGIWQDSENAWGMRLRARPVRTDLNLSDTGQVRINGTWQRAASLRTTPLRFSLQWDRAQLGQLTKLLTGQDKGWRGGVRWSGDLSGTPADLTVRSIGSVQDFRRYDILGGGVLEIRAACGANYSSLDRGLHRIDCRSPLGQGVVSLQGNLLNLLGPHTYDLTISAEKVPVQDVVAVIRHAKKELPADFQAAGTLAARFHARSTGDSGAPLLEGTGRVLDLRVRSESNHADLVLDQVPFTLVPPGTAGAHPRRRPKDERVEKLPTEPFLGFGPLPVRLGRPTPANVRGWLTRSEYALTVEGDAELRPLLQVARTLGFPSPELAANGPVRIDLQVAGQWAGFATPVTTGTAQLHTVQAEIRGLNAPLEIVSASVHLYPQKVLIDVLSASFGGSLWTGSLELPRACNPSATCPVKFALHTEELDTGNLSQLLNPNPPRRPWYRFLAPSAPQGPPLMARIHATGKLGVDRFVIQNLVATRVLANVDLNHGYLRVADLQADVLGGKHRGELQADFTAEPPVYDGQGTFQHVSLAQLAELMRDGWITGTGSATYQVKTSGYASAALLGSASGNAVFEMHEGSLPHVSLGSGHLHVRRLSGRLALHDGQFSVQDGKLESSAGTFLMSGTASLSRKIDLRLAHEGTSGYNITGTVSEPRVARATTSETQAVLQTATPPR